MTGFTDFDVAMMNEALLLARAAAQAGEVPVGAVVAVDGKILGSGANRSITDNDASAHAEIMALRDAGQHAGNYRLSGSTLYVTLEPCMMCTGALVHARVAQVIFAASDPKSGVLGGAADVSQGSWLNHKLACRGGLLADEASRMLIDFFKVRRQ